MYITLSKILAFPAMKAANVLAMKEMINKRTVSGVQILEGPEAWESVGYGEIVFISGIGMKSVETDLIHIVEKLRNKNVVLVLRMGKYVSEVSEEVIKACAECRVVLLAIDIGVKLQPITRKIYELLFDEENKRQFVDTLMKSLMQGNYSNEDAEEVYQLGFSTKQYHIATVLCIDDFFGYREKVGNNNYINTLTAIRYKLAVILKAKKQDLSFSTIDSNILCALMNNQDAYTDRKFMLEVFGELRKSVSHSFPDITFSIGVGTPFSQLAECERSVKEAKRTLQIVYVCKRTDTIRCYDDIGVYQLLFELQDQEKFEHIRDGIFGKLISHDTEKNDGLLETLEAYLDCDRNIGTAAQQMFLHRNTLKYRLNKIEEILLCDLSDVNTCFNLRLGFKINKFLKSEQMKF